MERANVEVGGFCVNCSILNRNGEAWIVDPGSDAETIDGILRVKSLVPKAILLTHAHFDHIGGIPALQDKYPDLPVYVHPNDLPVIVNHLNQYPPEYPAIDMPRNCRDCTKLDGTTVIETPGHTPGGVCYYFPEDKLLLSGDTLFAGSVGRTDLPGGNMATLTESLKKLSALPDDTTVVPGHGPCSTIGTEKRINPFL